MHLYCYFDTALRLFLKPDVHTHLIRKNAFLSNNDKFLEEITMKLPMALFNTINPQDFFCRQVQNVQFYNKSSKMKTHHDKTNIL